MSSGYWDVAGQVSFNSHFSEFTSFSDFPICDVRAPLIPLQESNLTKTLSDLDRSTGCVFCFYLWFSQESFFSDFLLNPIPVSWASVSPLWTFFRLRGACSVGTFRVLPVLLVFFKVNLQMFINSSAPHAYSTLAAHHKFSANSKFDNTACFCRYLPRFTFSQRFERGGPCKYQCTTINKPQTQTNRN